jgi:hypothetical protein
LEDSIYRSGINRVIWQDSHRFQKLIEACGADFPVSRLTRPLSECRVAELCPVVLDDMQGRQGGPLRRAETGYSVAR